LGPVLLDAPLNMIIDADAAMPNGRPPAVHAHAVLGDAHFNFNMNADAAMLGLPNGRSPVLPALLDAPFNIEANAGVLDLGCSFSNDEVLGVWVLLLIAEAEAVLAVSTTTPNLFGVVFGNNQWVTISGQGSHMRVVGLGTQHVIVQSKTDGYSMHHVDSVSHYEGTIGTEGTADTADTTATATAATAGLKRKARP
jgi:hypothetical protein